MHSHCLKNKAGLRVTILNYGAIIQSVVTLEGDNLVLGYPSPEQYLSNPCYLGCVIGPVANRIAQGQFVIDDQPFELEKNEKNTHSLHSGCHGLHQVYWEIIEADNEHIQLSYKKPAGEAGFPANVDFCIEYRLTDDNELIMHASATPDAATPIDLTNHTYWNLSGEETVENHQLRIYANHYLPTESAIPTGEIATTAGTALDFSAAKTLENQDLDHYFIVPNANKKPRLFASITGTYQLDIYSDAPGFQCYTGRFLTEPHQSYQGICIEPHGYPNAINCEAFPSPLIAKGAEYNMYTIYKIT